MVVFGRHVSFLVDTATIATTTVCLSYLRALPCHVDTCCGILPIDMVQFEEVFTPDVGRARALARLLAEFRDCVVVHQVGGMVGGPFADETDPLFIALR